ncbi:MAG: preprotein translocase subunit YajC [Deltaproteobacteria bacterium]|jgi:preprotein translocase subunit YajC|nr:preprotein translocase subunit YajC [Deltaproteobacteria bacterium]
MTKAGLDGRLHGRVAGFSHGVCIMLNYLLLSAAQAWAMAPPQSAEGGQPQGGGGGMQMILLLGGFFVIFYFLMLRPQKKQQRERQNMLDSIKKGDRIQTTGGLLGEVTAVGDKELTVRIAPEVRVKIARTAIAGVLRSTSEPAAVKPDLSKPE